MSTRVQRGLDPYGFEKSSEKEKKAYEEFQSNYLPVLARREGRWRSISEGTEAQRSAKLKRFVRKGIPSDMRSDLWMTISGAASKMSQEPGAYQSLLAKVEDDDANIESSLRVIREDLHRTFPENIHFRDIEADQMASLSNVLTAFVRKNPKIGYCQGLNYVTGMLLLVVKKEEKVFWLLHTLVNDILPDYYEPSLRALRIDVRVLSKLLMLKCPAVATLFEREGADLSLTCTKWIICIFADVLPTETTFRIWDSLFYEGPKIIFRTALTLIISNKQSLLKCQTLPEIVAFMRDELISDDKALHCHTFMEKIFKVPGSLPMAKINKFRQEAMLEIN